MAARRLTNVHVTHSSSGCNQNSPTQCHQSCGNVRRHGGHVLCVVEQSNIASSCINTATTDADEKKAHQARHCGHSSGIKQRRVSRTVTPRHTDKRLTVATFCTPDSVDMPPVKVTVSIELTATGVTGMIIVSGAALCKPAKVPKTYASPNPGLSRCVRSQTPPQTTDLFH